MTVSLEQLEAQLEASRGPCALCPKREAIQSWRLCWGCFDRYCAERRAQELPGSWIQRVNGGQS